MPERPPFSRRLRFRFPLGGAGRDVDREIAFHLEMTVRELEAAGMDPGSARDEAARRFGNLERHRRACRGIQRQRQRRARRTDAVSDLLQDLKIAFRGFRRSPGFTAVAVLTLALGIGATTAIYSAVNAVLLSPLPYSQPERLVRLYEENLERGWPRFGVSPQDFHDWRESVERFDLLAAYAYGSANMQSEGEAFRVELVRVSPELFPLLGIAPLRGRTFAAGEDAPGKDRVAVVSSRFWRRELEGDPEVLGRELSLDGERYVVVGVMPPEMTFPVAETDVWLPLPRNPDALGSRDSRWLGAVARLAPGATLEGASAELGSVTERLAARYPNTNKGWTSTIVPFDEWVVGDARSRLLTLWAAVGLVLLIACANVANLLLTRASGRAREIATRTALGAGKRRLVRQLLAESIALSFTGAAGGLILAYAVVAVLPAMAPDLPRAGEISVDGSVLGFTVLLALVAGILFGLAPALHAARADLTAALKEGGAAAGGSGTHGIERSLVVAELALALVLLVGAGLLARSFAGLLNVDPGFDPSGVLTFRIAPPLRADLDVDDRSVAFERYVDERDRMAVRWDGLLDELGALPGVRSVGAISHLPVGGRYWLEGITVEDDTPRASGDQPPGVLARVVTPGYFDTLRIAVRAGRAPGRQDVAGGRLVAAVNEAAAERFWPGRSALGSRFTLDDPADPDALWYAVVGVVGDVRLEDLETAPEPAVYLPFRQARTGMGGDWGLSVVLRTDGAPEALVDDVRARVRTLEPSLPVFQIRTLSTLVSDSLAPRRFTLALLGGFAILALILSVVGIYGVISHMVRRREHDLGVRVALGAGRREVMSSILGQVLLLTAVGVSLGLAGAFVLTRFLAGFVWGVSTADPWTFGVLAAALAGVALVAGYLPARRAAGLHPAAVLRKE